MSVYKNLDRFLSGPEESFIVQEALKVATLAHGGQIRKYSGVPYVEHCMEVADLVAATKKWSPAKFDVRLVCAALLHDTLEDTALTKRELQLKYGYVAALVDQLTDVSRPEDGNRSARKAKDLKHLEGASPGAQTIKLADTISNVSSILANDISFATVYVVELIQRLPLLTDGDPYLYRVAEQYLLSAQAHLTLLGRLKGEDAFEWSIP